MASLRAFVLVHCLTHFTKITINNYGIYLVSVCLSTAPEQMSCIRRGTQSRVTDSLEEIELNMEPTRLSLNLRAA